MAISLGAVVAVWLMLATDGSLDLAAATGCVAVLLGLAVFDDRTGAEWNALQDHAESLGSGNEGA